MLFIHFMLCKLVPFITLVVAAIKPSSEKSCLSCYWEKLRKWFAMAENLLTDTGDFFFGNKAQ